MLTVLTTWKIVGNVVHAITTKILSSYKIYICFLLIYCVINIELLLQNFFAATRTMDSEPRKMWIVCQIDVSFDCSTRTNLPQVHRNIYMIKNR